MVPYKKDIVIYGQVNYSCNEVDQYKLNDSSFVKEEKWGQLNNNSGCLIQLSRSNNLIKEIYTRSNQVTGIVT